MEILDLSNSEYSNRNGSYGGAAGDKDGIVINGEPWIAKYPKSNERMAKNNKLSKTSQTPLSEFIGSHIYEILGYPVHKTILGIRKNFLVVVCKDFCDERTRLLEMRTLKNIHISEMNQKFNMDLHETDDDHLVNLNELFVQQVCRIGQENCKNRKIAPFGPGYQIDNIHCQGDQGQCRLFRVVQCEIDAEAAKNHKNGTVGISVFINDPSAVSEALSVCHIPCAGNPCQSKKQKRQYGSCLDPAIRCLFCIFISNEREKTDCKYRHLNHAGEIADVISGTDISVSETVQAMQQAENTGCRIEKQLLFFISGYHTRRHALREPARPGRREEIPA